MKPKRKLKNWVKITLLFLPVAIIIIQLFFIGLNISKKPAEKDISIKIESRCIDE